jgi:hypothetical protein
LPDPMVWAPRQLDSLISDPKEAPDVFDFEPVAKRNVPPAHFGYMATGIDDEVTLRANREGFLKFQLRPRRLVDVSAIDMTVDIFGARYDSPRTEANRRAFVAKRWEPHELLRLATSMIGEAVNSTDEAVIGSRKRSLACFDTLAAEPVNGMPGLFRRLCFGPSS